MTDQTIEQKVKNFLVRDLNLPDTLERDQPILTSGLLDSLSVIKIFMLAEVEFGITLSALDFSQEAFDTVAGISELIQDKIG